MRFVLVNGRTPCSPCVCAMCNRQIGAGYLREAGTQLIYCDHTCYTDHCNGAFRSLEGQAKAS
jgi:hypothetical protein